MIEQATVLDSRRLLGPSRLMDRAGAVLEFEFEASQSDQLISRWAEGLDLMLAALGWSPATPRILPRRDGASLGFEAPADLLLTATEVNEWAWAHAVERAGGPAAEPRDAARARISLLASEERRPGLIPLEDAARSRNVALYGDDDSVTIGMGSGSRTFALDALPDAGAVDWSAVHDVPLALVTGSNGKTTTVRLIAAILRADGRHPGWSSTDGVMIEGERIAEGDYSGPEGARLVLRDQRIDAAVLETARGGILRRGLAVTSADVAVITNIAADHFGEYGVHDLETLIDVKLAVARALGADGLLVVNADDPLLAGKAAAAGKPLGWFAQDADHPLLAAHRVNGGATAGVRAGRLVLSWHGAEHDLGAIAAMPLAAGGHSHFNIANLATAALGAAGLGVEPATIAALYARFGADPADNAGRLMRYELGGLNLIVDFAHNPAALAGLVDFAQHLRGGGRLAVLLGQAGNREDADLARLATVAAAARPDLVVLKEMRSYLRGRDAGEIPAILRRALGEAGVADAAIVEVEGEDAAVRHALAWARAGDVLMLAVHTPAGRTAALILIDRLRRQAWTAGQPLPA